MEDGIHLAQGDSIRTSHSRTTVTWEQASARILELLEAGTYLSAAELEQAREHTLLEMAEELMLTVRELTEEGRRKGLFAQTLVIHDQRKSYPELAEDVVAFAKGEGGLAVLAEEYQDFLRAYEQDRSIMRFRLSEYSTHRIGVVLGGIDLPERSFAAQSDFLRRCKMFITQDEIDRFFLAESADSRLDVYAFFCYPHTKEEQQKFIKKCFGEYSGGGCDGYDYKLTLVNRQLNRQEFSRNLLMAYRQDGRDYMRREYNDILLDKASGSNNLVQEKYITVSVAKHSIEEARTFFARVGTDLTAGLSRMDSGIREITLNERLRLFHDFFRVGQESAFAFDLQTAQRRGHDFRDAIAPETLQFFPDHYAVDERVGRTLFLREYASFIKDTMITELMDYPRNMMLSIDIVPVATDEAVSEMHRRIMAVESDITRWQQRQNHHNNFSANIPYDLEQMRKETREFLDDLSARDQRMMYALVTLTHLADNEEQLEQDTEALSAIGRSHGCQFATMKHQQEDALNTVLPYGLRRIDAMRTLTTESTAVLLPFKTQEIMDTGGLYYGVNAVSRNLIICNRDAMLNGHGLYTGVSGSGKSMMAKQEIGFVGLNTNHDIIVVDPEREYGPLIRALGGEVITISASNGSYVNALDISKEYGDGRNPLVLKSEFIMSLCEQLMGAGEIGAKEKSIIDRCTANIYRKYIHKYEGDPPTLKDLYDDLMRQKEPVAHEIALALELFTAGSLNVFAHQTNIDTRNRIICYDIQDLGENLKPIGLLVMLDSILNRVIRNRQQGRYTHVYIDEIYLFFASPGVGGKSAINNYSSEFLYKCWKRFRKYYATLTGITQNVEECLLSDTARLMFANSEFLVLLNQAPTDRAELAKLLDASDAQMDYVSDAPAGHGLIKVGSCLVPFINELPRDTELYRLMTTKPGEQNA